MGSRGVCHNCSCPLDDRGLCDKCDSTLVHFNTCQEAKDAEIARLRARVAELDAAVRVMTDVAQEQVRRLERWSKVHNELDGAIANARAALEKR